MARCAADGCHGVIVMHGDVAVAASHAGLLVDVGAEIVLFDPVWPGWVGAVWLVGGAILMFEVVIETTIIITADPVAVMTAQAAAVGWLGEKLMGHQLAVLIFEMTGSATGTVAYLGIFIPLIINMATQAATSQQIIGQLQG